MTGMTTIIEIDHLMARIGKDRCVTLSVLVADGECFIEASSDFERAGVRLSLPPEDMIALGHACIAAGRYMKQVLNDFDAEDK